MHTVGKAQQPFAELAPLQHHPRALGHHGRPLRLVQAQPQRCLAWALLPGHSAEKAAA